MRVSIPGACRLFAVLGLVGCAAAVAQPVAFTGVNVVPMDAERVLRDQTVLVEDGHIAAIGPALPLPPEVQIIDGHGAWLSPGLADMHSHSDTRGDMAVYLANGVTTLLNMGGASAEFMGQRRPAINQGRIPGPHVYAAFRVDGSPRYGQFVVTTPREARAVVRLARTNGYDFIKVYNDLSPECFRALVTEGRKLHLAVVGHGVSRVGIERQLAAGQVMVAHAEEYLYTVFPQPPQNQPDAAPGLEQIPRAVAFTRRSGAWVTADLNTYASIARQWGRPEVVDAMFQRPEMRYLAPSWRIDWRGEDYVGRKGSLAARLEFLAHFVKALSDGGVPLLAGTDAPTIPGILPGYSLHEDLAALESAGLSRYQALATATRTPGEFIHRWVPGADRFGTVTPGSRADLVLTAANPLDGLATLRQPLGVMAAGKWYAASDLQALLDGVVRKYDEALLPPAK